MLFTNNLKTLIMISGAISLSVPLFGMQDTPLHILKTGSEEAVIELYEKGTLCLEQRIYLDDDCCVTPAYYAAERNQVKVLIYLAQHNVNLTAALSSGSLCGLTPLYCAATKGFLEIVQFLCKHGADPHMPLMRGLAKGSTPFFAACKHKQFHVALFMLDLRAHYNVNVSVQDLTHFASVGNVDAVRFLVEHDLPLQKSMRDYYSPVFAACRNGHLDVLRYLHDNGSDICMPMPRGKFRGLTPLLYACFYGNLEIVKYLMGYCVGPTATGLTPMDIAIKKGHCALAHYLFKDCHMRCALDKIFDDDCFEDLIIDLCDQDNCWWQKPIIIEDQYQVSLPYLAAIRGHIKLMHLLFARIGAAINEPLASRNEQLNGQTPLFGAAKNGQLELVKFLVEETGADLDAPLTDGPYRGKKPLDIAYEQGHREIVKYIVQTKGSLCNEEAILQCDREEKLANVCKNGFDFKNKDCFHAPNLESMHKRSVFICLEGALYSEWIAAKEGRFHCGTGYLKTGIKNNFPIVATRSLMHALFILSRNSLLFQRSLYFDSLENSAASDNNASDEAALLFHILKKHWSVYVDQQKEFFVLLPHHCVNPEEYGFNERLVPVHSHALIDMVRTDSPVSQKIDIENLCSLFSDTVHQKLRIFLWGHSGKNLFVQVCLEDLLKLIQFFSKRAEFLFIETCYLCGNSMLRVNEFLVNRVQQELRKLSLSSCEKEHLKLVVAIQKWQQLLASASLHSDHGIHAVARKALNTLKLKRESLEELMNKQVDELPESNHSSFCNTCCVVVKGVVESVTLPTPEMCRLFAHLDLYLNQDIAWLKKEHKKIYTLADVLRCLYKRGSQLCLTDLPNVWFSGGHNSCCKLLNGLDPAILSFTYARLCALRMHFLEGKLCIQNNVTATIDQHIKAIGLYPCDLSAVTFVFKSMNLPRLMSLVPGPAQHHINTLIVPPYLFCLSVLDQLFFKLLSVTDDASYDEAEKLWCIDRIKDYQGIILYENLIVYTKGDRASIRFRSRGELWHFRQQRCTENSPIALSLPLFSRENSPLFPEPLDSVSAQEFNELIVRTMPLQEALSNATHGYETVADIQRLASNL